MKKFAAHGPMLSDEEYGGYYRAADVDARFAEMQRRIDQLQTELSMANKFHALAVKERNYERTINNRRT